MISEIKMFQAHCDHCGIQWMDDCHSWVAMIDVSSLEDCLSDHEWITDNEKTYCPECCWRDDEDELRLRESRKNLNK